MADIVIRTPDAGEIASKSSGVEQASQMLVVSDSNSYEAGLIFVRDMGTRSAAIKELFKESKAAAHAAHRAICDLESKALTPYGAARAVVERKCLAWKQEAERVAREEQERIAAELRKQEEDARLARALKLEDQGLWEEAEEAIERPVAVPYVRVEPEIVKVQGVSTRKTWRARVVDFDKLVAYVAKSEAYMSLLKPDDAALGRLASATRGNLRIPGVEFYQQESLGVRAAVRDGK